MRFKALDGFRGLCAILVVLYHFPVANHLIRDRFFLPHAQMLLDFFFVMSGFIIAGAYAGKLKTWTDARDFAQSRFARLWPLHATMLGFLVAVEVAKAMNFPPFADPPAFTGDRPPLAIVTNLLMIQSLHVHPMLTWNFPSWTVSTEFFTYLLFAGSTVIAPRRPILVAATLAVAGGLGVALVAHKLNASIDFGFLRCGYGFFCGVLTWHAWKHAPLARLAAVQRSRTLGTMIEAAALVGVFGYMAFLGGAPFGYVGPLAFAIFIWVFAAERGGVARLLAWRPFVRLGEISYSIYLVHFPVLVLMGVAAQLFESASGMSFAAMGYTGVDALDHIRGPSLWILDAVMVVYLAAVFAVAQLTYRYVETPGRALFRPGRRPAAPALVAAAAV